MTTTIDMQCVGCERRPSEIPEYVEEAAYLNGLEDNDTEWTPEMYVQAEEGTYNPENGHFACTDCYVKMGMPSSPRGWKAP